MSRSYFLILIFLITFPIFGHSSNEKHKFMIEKQKLKCLYEEIDDLLDEKSDPVWILLRTQCTLTNSDKPRVILGPPTIVNPETSNNPSMTEDDILQLSKNQLRCFKESYLELMEQIENPVTVRFMDDCITSKK